MYCIYHLCENLTGLLSLTSMCEWKSRLGTSDNLLLSIQEKIKWADTMNELDKKHHKDVEDKVEEVKKSLSQKVSWIPVLYLKIYGFTRHKTKINYLFMYHLVFSLFFMIFRDWESQCVIAIFWCMMGYP